LQNKQANSGRQLISEPLKQPNKNYQKLDKT
jgi:hypothetical protein